MTAIVTDAHYRMSVSLIRDLADRGVRVVACEKASIKNPVGFASRGVLRCVRLPEEGYLDALLALCREIFAQEEKARAFAGWGEDAGASERAPRALYPCRRPLHRHPHAISASQR